MLIISPPPPLTLTLTYLIEIWLLWYGDKEKGIKAEEFLHYFIISETFTLSTCLSNVNSATIPQKLYRTWTDTSKSTLEKSISNAINAILHLLEQTNWKNTWLEENIKLAKKHTNATIVTLSLSRHAMWQSIWELTIETRTTNATCVTMQLTRRSIWGDMKGQNIKKRWM